MGVETSVAPLKLDDVDPAALKAQAVPDTAFDRVIEAGAACDAHLFAAGEAHGAVTKVEVAQSAQEAASGLFADLMGVLAYHGGSWAWGAVLRYRLAAVQKLTPWWDPSENQARPWNQMRHFCACQP